MSTFVRFVTAWLGVPPCWRTNDEILPLADLIAARGVLPENNLSGFGIDILLLQPVTGLPVNPIEAHFFR